MSQRIERAKISLSVVGFRLRGLVHTVASIAAFAVLLAGVAVVFGPAVVTAVPATAAAVRPLVTLSGWLPVPAVVELLGGIVAVALLYRL